MNSMSTDDLESVLCVDRTDPNCTKRRHQFFFGALIHRDVVEWQNGEGSNASFNSVCAHNVKKWGSVGPGLHYSIPECPACQRDREARQQAEDERRDMFLRGIGWRGDGFEDDLVVEW